MPNQPIKLPDVEYEMLCVLAKNKQHKQVIEYLRQLINQQYGRK